MTPNVAKCLLVSKVLVADGMMADSERAYLESIMVRFGLTPEERHGVIELEDMEAAEPILAALSVEDRLDIIELLVDAAASDGHLSPHELSTIQRVEKALGVDVK
jgi:uncharacterized tellurite resistance protein B-like protein